MLKEQAYQLKSRYNKSKLRKLLRGKYYYDYHRLKNHEISHYIYNDHGLFFAPMALGATSVFYAYSIDYETFINTVQALERSSYILPVFLIGAIEMGFSYFFNRKYIKRIKVKYEDIENEQDIQ